MAGTLILVGSAVCGGDEEETASPTPAVVQYQVSINFTEAVTQADMDSVAAYLRGFDPAAEMLILETFPPMGRAAVHSASSGSCTKVRADLSARPYVRSVTCEVAPPSPSDSPDEPMSTTAGG